MTIINTTIAQLDISTPVVTCGDVSVQFTANGDTQCRLDSGFFTDCASPYRQSGLHGGQHVITIRTSDGRDGYKQDSVSFHMSGMSYTASYIALLPRSFC